MSDAMPEPDRLWTVGTAPGIFPSISHGIALFRRPLAFLNSLPARGDLVEIRLGPLRAWMVCHPELVHRMLMDPRTFDKGGSQYDRLRALMGDGVVTCRQEGHRRQRTLLQPDFRASRVADYTELMGEEAESVCRTWRAGQRIDVSAAMMALTTRVTSRVLLSDSLDDARAAQIRSALGTIVRGLFVRTVVPVDAPFRVPTPANRRYRRAVDRLHGIIDSVIAERRRGAPRDDVLGTLLAAARDGGEDPRSPNRKSTTSSSRSCITGVETTALCMASAFSLLAQHPETERRLHSEVDSCSPGGDGPASTTCRGSPTPGPPSPRRCATPHRAGSSPASRPERRSSPGAESPGAPPSCTAPTSCTTIPRRSPTPNCSCPSAGCRGRSGPPPHSTARCSPSPREPQVHR
jgi:cytochrome P450